MARTSWIDHDSHPDLDAHVEQLSHFTASLADGDYPVVATINGVQSPNTTLLTVHN